MKYISIFFTTTRFSKLNYVTYVTTRHIRPCKKCGRDLERNAFAEEDDSLQGAPLHVVLLVLTPRCKSTNSLEIVIASKKVIEYGRYSGSKRPNTCRTVEIHSFTPSY